MMPFAVAMGVEPAIPFVGGMPLPEGINEGDFIGGYFEEPIEVVDAKTVDSFIKGMESIKGYPHPFGGPEISFGPQKHLGSDESVFLQVKGGKWIYPSGKKEVFGY